MSELRDMAEAINAEAERIARLRWLNRTWWFMGIPITMVESLDERYIYTSAHPMPPFAFRAISRL